MKHPHPIGKCPLCLEEKLLAHSHVIPEFNYLEFYDEKHRLRTFEGDGTVQDRKPMQNGIREYLLCGSREGERKGCEGKLSVWEDHAARLIRPGKIDPISVPGKKSLVLKIRYADFKLYGMSLIWRLAVTSHRNLSIGSLGKVQEELREALDKGDPLIPAMHPFYIRAFVAPDGNFYSDWMSPPFRHEFYGKNAYSMAIGGLVYTFVARAPDVPEEIRLASPQVEEDLHIPVLPISLWPEYEAFYVEQVQAAKRHAARRKA